MTRRGLVAIFIAVALLALGVWAITRAMSDPDVPTPQVHRWRVYDGSLLILDVSDRPGPLTSTALTPPGYKPVMHPFLSASAHSARHEDRLATILKSSTDLQDFLTRLRAEGFTVESENR
jgi:hypothetical protein